MTMKEHYFSSLKDVDIHSGTFVFKDVFEVFNFLRFKGWNIGWYAAPNFEVMQLDESRVVAAPVPFTPLFRGQNAYFAPCLPSLYRRGWTPLEELERLVQLEDFKQILSRNPEIQDQIEGGLTVNYMGLAQHYGIETNIIDLTNSFGVAAFFATSYYDALADCYYPVMECVKMGVIYFQPMGLFCTEFHKNNPIWPIGMEALSRPGEQRGYGAYLREGSDFNWICPCRFFFWQNANASIRCFNLFNGGAALFPYDPMAEKVRCIRKYRVYGKDSIIKVVDEYRDKIIWSVDEAEKRLVENGCTVLSTTPFHYTQEELSYITNRYHRTYPGSFSNDL